MIEKWWSGNLPPSCPPCLLCCPGSFSQRPHLHAHLISKENQGNYFIFKPTYVPEPRGNIIKALGIGDVIHQHNTFKWRGDYNDNVVPNVSDENLNIKPPTHGTPVVRGGDCVKPLLMNKILKLEFFVENPSPFVPDQQCPKSGAWFSFPSAQWSWSWSQSQWLR